MLPLLLCVCVCVRCRLISLNANKYYSNAAKSDNIWSLLFFYHFALRTNRSVFNRFKRAIKPHNFNLNFRFFFYHQQQHQHHFSSCEATRRLELNCMHRIPGFSSIFKTILTFFRLFHAQLLAVDCPAFCFVIFFDDFQFEIHCIRFHCPIKSFRFYLNI